MPTPPTSTRTRGCLGGHQGCSRATDDDATSVNPVRAFFIIIVRSKSTVAVAVPVAVVCTPSVTRLNLSQFLLCGMLFCKRKQVTVKDAYVQGQKVMGQTNRKLGKLLLGLPEDLHFCASFGVSAEVAVEAWAMMADHNCLPPNPKFSHYLWALAFMKNYPGNHAALLILLEGKDPKTIYKYMWQYSQSLFGLHKAVVS